MLKFFRAFTVLSPKAKRRMLLLLPVIIVGMALETLSVGMVLPALGILMSETYFESVPLLASFINFIGNPSHDFLVFLGLSGLAGAFILKNLFLFYQVHCLGTFVYGAQREIAVELFRSYLNKSYIYHLEVNSAILLRNITGEVNSYSAYFLMPSINFLTESLVIIGILGLVFWIEPAGTLLLILFLGILVYLFVRATKRIVGSWGQKRIFAEEQKMKHLKQGFDGIKEIILSGKLEFFIKRFYKPNQVAGLMNKREYILQYVPKQGIEVIAICGLIGMCVFLISQGKPKTDVMYILGLLASAGFRIIPSFSRILNNLQSMRYGWASVDALKHEFSLKRDDCTYPSSLEVNSGSSSLNAFKNEILIENISFSYSQKSEQVFSGVNMKINKGETIGLIGPSGSGKSTLTNLILGVFQPSSGAIYIDGKLLNKDNVSSWQQMIGYVPQEIYLLDDTIRRNIAFGIEDSDIDDAIIMSVIKLAQLESLVDQTKLGLDRMLGERGAHLSGGQKQRIGIARALYNDPQVIILDEATSALDGKTEKGILESLEPLQGDKTILIITHRQSSLKICSKVFEISAKGLIKA
jgi:ABC-type multidrug transport system fused ATPase/permease subunit